MAGFLWQKKATLACGEYIQSKNRIMINAMLQILYTISVT